MQEVIARGGGKVAASFLAGGVASQWESSRNSL